MKKILVPVDFSKIAENAVKYALEISNRLGAEMVFIHLISTPIPWKDIPLEKENLYPHTKIKISDAKAKLEKMVMEAEKKGVDASYSLIYNTAIGELYKYIDPEYYQLVVMGTHGEVGIEQILGSNTFNTLKRSKIPVLAIRENNDFRLMNEIIIASDFEEKSRSSFDLLFDMAQALKLRIKILYINVPYNFKETPEIEKMVNLFIENKVIDRVDTYVINALNEERGIGIFIADHKPDIIATVTHGRSVINNLFSPSITEGLLSDFHLPVLSINMNPK